MIEVREVKIIKDIILEQYISVVYKKMKIGKIKIEETIDKTVIETVHIRRERGGLMNASSFCYQFRIFSLIRSRWERKIFGGEDNM